jgi:hypothetical protein
MTLSSAKTTAGRLFRRWKRRIINGKHLAISERYSIIRVVP